MDDLERILERDERIEPSSGLADSVMRAVLEEARTLPPLSFPWRRFALGMGSCLALLAVGFVLFWIEGAPDPVSTPPQAWLPDTESMLIVGLPALALILTYAATRLSLRVTR